MIRSYFQRVSDHIDNGKLIKSGQDFYVRYTSHTDIPQNLALQNNVLDALKKINKTYYLIFKDSEYLRKHMNAGHKIVGTFVKTPGILSQDKLVAHLLITNPCTEEEAGVADPSLLPSKDLESISVVSNILVHQDYRGNKLMQQMLDHWLQIAIDNGKEHAIAEASADNQFSWSVFLDSGFVIYGAAFDRRDGTNNFYLHKPLSEEFIYSQDPHETKALKLFDESGDIDEKIYETLESLFENGYHAVDFDKHTNTIIVAKCIGTRPIAEPNTSPGGPSQEL